MLHTFACSICSLRIFSKMRMICFVLFACLNSPIQCRIVLFQSPRCRTVIQALQPNLRDDMALKEKEVRQITNQNCSRQLLTSHTAQRAVRRPIERSPTAPNEPLRSANLHATHLHGGRVDANASRALATRSGDGRNCPRFFRMMIPLHNFPITNHGSIPRPLTGDSRVAKR